MPNVWPLRAIGLNFPELSALVPNDRLDLSLERDVIANLEVVCHPPEVPQVFTLQTERIWIFEINAVDMRVGAARGINSGARVLVFIPGTAHFIVLFDHKVRDARMLQLNGGVQTSHASANDGYHELPQVLRSRRILPNQPPRP